MVTPVAAAGWLEHLRDGGTTPWPAWRDTHADGASRADHGRRVPGAQQLELLRRLNLAGTPGRALADRVLAAGTTGRGRPDLDLDAGGAPPGGFGAAPADPTTLPAEELLRVAVGLVAEDLAAGPPPSVEPPAWSFLVRHRWRVVGDPRLADPVRDELARRGRTIGGPGARVVVLGAGTGQMLADAWVSAGIEEGVGTWPEWVAARAERPDPPSRVDLAGAARTWAARVGARRVHVVVDPAALPALLRTRALPAPPDPVPAHAAELARRVAAVLGVLVDPRRRHELAARVLLPRVTTAARAVDPLAAPLGVPPRQRPWRDRTAARVHGDVLAAGYPVHGDPARLLDADDGVVPTADGALEVAVATLLDRAGREQGEVDRA